MLSLRFGGLKLRGGGLSASWPELMDPRDPNDPNVLRPTGRPVFESLELPSACIRQIALEHIRLETKSCRIS